MSNHKTVEEIETAFRAAIDTWCEAGHKLTFTPIDKDTTRCVISKNGETKGTGTGNRPSDALAAAIQDAIPITQAKGVPQNAEETPDLDMFALDL